jgi:signal transduction histidine kinase
MKHFLKAFKYRPGFLYYVTLTVCFLTISIVTTKLVGVSLHERELLIRSHLDKMTMQYLADLSVENRASRVSRDKSLQGIAVYKSDGSTVYSYGIVTQDPRLSGEKLIETLYFNESQKLVLLNTKLIGLFDKLPYRPYESADFESDYIFTVHLEVKDERFFKEKTILRIIQSGVYLILILIYIQMLNTYKRSNDLKNELDSQKNLVILGTALRTLTHEMKNPLAAIRLQSGYIRKLHSDDLLKETIVIDKEVDRLARLMEVVRDYLKEPIGKCEIFDAQVYLRDLKPLFPPDLQWSFSDNGGTICFDRDRFRSVIENLINNAIESKSAHSDISIICSVSKKHFEIVIKDKGTGISSEIIEKIFDPFFTTKSQGSGAGLMIVKRFVEAAGGYLTIESVEGLETIVHLRLPIKQESQK